MCVCVCVGGSGKWLQSGRPSRSPQHDNPLPPGAPECRASHVLGRGSQQAGCSCAGTWADTICPWQPLTLQDAPPLRGPWVMAGEVDSAGQRCSTSHRDSHGSQEGPHRGLGGATDHLKPQFHKDQLIPSWIPGILYCLEEQGQNLSKYLF